MKLLRKLMDRGFLIFRDDAKFVLKKIATPNDPRVSITDEIQADTSVLTFDDYGSAIKMAKTLIGEEDQPCHVCWRGRMMYLHKGLGVRFEELGQMENMSYKQAVKEAEHRAQKFDDMDEMIESWEVKVFPCKPEK